MSKLAAYGAMICIATDQMRGRLYRCPCGAERWSCWGVARKHAERCKLAKRKEGAI